jgi:hypothetical protein
MTVTTPSFRRLADMHDQGLVLKPLVEAYLLEARFPDRFDVTFHKAGKARHPDDWFHPSTHPLWDERLLYHYLMHPDDMEAEQLSYESRMAVTMGTAVHGFVEMCIRDAKIMVPLSGTCPACGRPHGTKKDQCDEFGAADPVLKRRGHMDGVMIINVDGTIWKSGMGGLEFKTTNPNAARGIIDNDLVVFRKKWPVYYAQVQEYMDLSGLRQFIVLVAILGFPWKLVEFQIEYDIGFAMEIKNKYQRVRDHVKMMYAPDPCCAPRSATAKQCPARFVCAIGKLR